MALSRACSLNSVPLLDRIWSSCSPESAPSPAALGPGNGGEWSRRKYLRTDRHYNFSQFQLAMIEAVTHHAGMDVFRWLFDHFHDCVVPERVVTVAASEGNIVLLRFLLDHGDLQRTERCWMLEGSPHRAQTQGIGCAGVGTTWFMLLRTGKMD